MEQYRFQIVLKEDNNKQWFINAVTDSANNKVIYLQDTTDVSFTERLEICEGFSMKLISNKLVINSNSTYVELSELNCAKATDGVTSFTTAKDILDYINAQYLIQ